jgi:putative component of membrane protein insertase Oxa1/YidC/SpoIIIJ protein YidD
MNRIVLALLTFTLLFAEVRAQQADSAALMIRTSISSQLFSPYKAGNYQGRKIMSLKDKSTLQKLNPLMYFSAGMLFLYQRGLSEQIQANCTFQTTCSGYTKMAIQERGFFVGVVMGADQMMRCTPQSLYDYPLFKLTSNRKIIDADIR